MCRLIVLRGSPPQLVYGSSMNLPPGAQVRPSSVEMWTLQAKVVRYSVSAMTSSPDLGFRASWGVAWARAGSGLVVTWTAAVTTGSPLPAPSSWPLGRAADHDEKHGDGEQTGRQRSATNEHPCGL